MENIVTNISKELNQEAVTQDALGQSKLHRLINWWNTKAFPAVQKGYTNLHTAISNVRINWVGLLVMVILAFMAENGSLDEMPNIKWFVESAVRMTEWCFDLLHSLIAWIANFLDSKFVNMFDIFGIFEWMANFLRGIFAL